MRGWMIAALVLLILFLLGQIRVGVEVQYSRDGLGIRARLGWIRLKLFPRAKKTDKADREEKPRKREKEKPAEPAEEKKESTLGGPVALARELLPLALEAAGQLRRKLVVDRLELRLTVGSDDPGDAALLYGQANAVLGALWQPLTESFHVKNGRAHVEVDFDAAGMTLYGLAALSLKIGQILHLGLYFGIQALRRLLRLKKRQKAKAGKAV